MDTHAFVQLFLFFGSWLGGAAVVPAGLAFWWWYGQPWLLILLASYYVYRFFFPRKAWLRLHALQCDSAHNHRYFDVQETVFEEGEAPAPTSKALLAFHPHGILCCGWSLNGNCNKEVLKSNVFWLGTDALFMLPVISDMLSWYNCGPASKQNMLRLMGKGENLALLPGGFEEATFYQRGVHRVFIKNRKGFIKYALQHGYAVHPVYTFGEERTYSALSWVMERMAFLNKYKLPAVIFAGRLFSFMPDNRAELVTVIGKPLQLPLIPSPSAEEVSQHHVEYVEALQGLFKRYKGRYAAEGEAAELEVL